MTEVQHKSTRELISTIESKDRRFRTAWVLFMFIILLVLIAVVAFQLRTLQGVKDQLAQQKVLLEAQRQSTDELKKNTDEQLGKVSKQIDCIAAFFTQKNRTNVVITDLQQCQIIRDDGSLSEPLIPTDGQSTQGGSAPQQSQQPSGSGGGGQTPSNTQQNSPATTPEQPQPVKVLGVPVCVPFTGVCVRE